MKDLKNSVDNQLKVILTPRPDAHPGQERRQLPRVILGTEQFKMAGSGRVYSVADLSMTGLALWGSDPAEWGEFSVGLKLEGTIKIREERFPLEMRIRNLSKNRAGCEFLSVSPAWVEALQNFFDPESLGRSLKPIPSMDRGMLWYFGASGTHLSLRRLSDGQFDQLTLCFLGNMVQWDAEGGIRSGRLVSSDLPSELHGIFRLDTLFFEQDSSMDKEKLEVAKKVILSAPIPEDVRGWGSRQFSR
jgi:hypothetical protein